ncbi:cell wall metabolism sensor histidine kinase WalK [Saccharibacillus sp. JS10]|uniref:sensor histidine kinase n=1 Tax=Saccharibacillus sp. JS10 TaxID=2950552 RepID=UPI00210B2AA5|nr:HAMP domain-containing sensor histidine kinase [Saccharibacillus sp. JS10]MCQ4087845.1 HAMP domain-containing histidine kinase [Saccharibacillus sp. JS10]
MIRSLYTRVVLIFLVSAIGSTLLAFWLATWAFRDQMNENLQIPLFQFAEDIGRLYEVMPSEQADKFVSEMKQLDSYYIRIYETPEQFQRYGTPASHETTITPDMVQRVFDGEKIRINTNGVTIELIGMSIQTNQGVRAMFIEPVGSATVPFIVKWLLNFSLYALVAGSLVFLGAAAFIVRPIQQLTRATRRIAAGNFDVKLDIRQKGELGELARSFEEMSQDLRQLEEMRRDFVGNVSHEIRSPLTSISGYAQALKHSSLSDEQRSRYLDIIASEANRISRMSDNLLKLSVLESKPLLQRAEIRLDEQIRRVVIALQPQWSIRQIEFDLELPVVEFIADADQLEQVWINMIGNAIKFSPDHGTISITLTERKEQIYVQIADQGVGIKPQDLERVFERFFKADRSRSRQYEGSGIGLAIVRQIVRLHHGKVEVESEYGQGTVFTVTLPREVPRYSDTSIS